MPLHASMYDTMNTESIAALEYSSDITTSTHLILGPNQTKLLTKFSLFLS